MITGTATHRETPAETVVYRHRIPGTELTLTPCGGGGYRDPEGTRYTSPAAAERKLRGHPVTVHEASFELARGYANHEVSEAVAGVQVAVREGRQWHWETAEKALFLAYQALGHKNPGSGQDWHRGNHELQAALDYVNPNRRAWSGHRLLFWRYLCRLDDAEAAHRCGIPPEQYKAHEAGALAIPADLSARLDWLAFDAVPDGLYVVSGEVWRVRRGCACAVDDVVTDAVALSDHLAAAVRELIGTTGPVSVPRTGGMV